MREGVERRLFVAATNQNDGKTTCSLGFVNGFRGLAGSIGFIKPVGQRYVMVEGQQIDEDSLLIQLGCGLRCPLRDMSPVAIPKNFTREFLDDPERLYPKLEADIRTSFGRAAEGNDLVVIEGTGHAGVGSVLGLSNARVARILDAKVVIVTLGGIGRPVDEVALNCSLFEKESVPVVGVVANKVLPEKLDQTRHYLTKAFDRCGLRLLGVIPFQPRLAWPTVQQVADAMDAQILNGHDCLGNEIASMLVGAMMPHNALTYVREKSLLIVPGDRDDLVLAILSMQLLRRGAGLSGILFTGGLRPQPQTMELVCCTDTPVLATKALTYEAAAGINDMIVKICLTDEHKIELANSLVREHVDLETLWAALA